MEELTKIDTGEGETKLAFILQFRVYGFWIFGFWRGGGGEYDKACFYLGEGRIFRLVCCGVPHVAKILVIGQSNGFFLEGKKKPQNKAIVHTPPH